MLRLLIAGVAMYNEGAVRFSVFGGASNLGLVGALGREGFASGWIRGDALRVEFALANL